MSFLSQTTFYFINSFIGFLAGDYLSFDVTDEFNFILIGISVIMVVIGFVAVQWNEVMPDNIDKKTVEHLARYLEESVKRMMLNEAKMKHTKQHWFWNK